jgi:ligand-binding sensor domain-containing protein
MGAVPLVRCAQQRVHRIRPDGVVENYGIDAGFPSFSDEVFFEDRQGRIWMGPRGGLIEIDPNPRPGRKLVLRRVDTLFGASENIIEGICQTPDDHLWLASESGLLEYSGALVRRFTKRNGLSQYQIYSVLPRSRRKFVGRHVWLGGDASQPVWLHQLWGR